MQKPFLFNAESIAAGSRGIVDLKLPSLNSRTELDMPVHVVHGRQAGPTLFVSAAVHGDEINNIEITQRLLEHRTLRSLRGTLLVVPVVNV